MTSVSPANQVALFSVRANKLASWKTGLTHLAYSCDSCVDAKVEAMLGLLDAFGNCSTRLNLNASRFTMLFTLDYDSSGMLTSGSLQVCNTRRSLYSRGGNGGLAKI
jgi:myosin-18